MFTKGSTAIERSFGMAATGIAGGDAAWVAVDGSLAARDHTGGTSPRQVRAQVERWRERLQER
jgi:argininosuccinate lyase